MLTEKNLAEIESKLSHKGYSQGVVEAVIDEVLSEDIPALIATCRELLPLSDALTSGEAEQYKKGWNAALNDVLGQVRYQQLTSTVGSEFHSFLLSLMQDVTARRLK